MRLEATGLAVSRFRTNSISCSETVVTEVAIRCSFLYDSIFVLRGWKKEKINGMDLEFSSIIAQKWKGKVCRHVILR